MCLSNFEGKNFGQLFDMILVGVLRNQLEENIMEAKVALGRNYASNIHALSKY